MICHLILFIPGCSPQSASEAVSAASQVQPVLLVLDATTLPWRQPLLSACPTIRACFLMGGSLPPTASSPPPHHSHRPPSQGTAQEVSTGGTWQPGGHTACGAFSSSGCGGGGTAQGTSRAPAAPTHCASHGANVVRSMGRAGGDSLQVSTSTGGESPSAQGGPSQRLPLPLPVLSSSAPELPCWSMADVVAVGREYGRMKVMAARMRRRMVEGSRTAGGAAAQAGGGLQGEGGVSEGGGGDGSGEWPQEGLWREEGGEPGRSGGESSTGASGASVSPRQLKGEDGERSREGGCGASEVWRHLQLRSNDRGVALICFTSGKRSPRH